MLFWKNHWRGICALVFILTLFPSVIFAYDGKVGYSVRAILPPNQIDQSLSYFDLLMKPGEKQDIQVEVFNSSSSDTEINIYITNAVTSRNGLIDYTNVSPVLDESILYPLTELATIVDSPIYIPAKKSKIVVIKLKMPNEKFQGTILGGIYFEKEMNNDNGSQENVQITNKGCYVLGLKLSMEDSKTLLPELCLKNVKPGLINYRTAIIADIQNKSPVIVTDLEIQAKVFNKKGKKQFERNVKNYQMAPNSTMGFMLDLENSKLLPGDYMMEIDAVATKGQWQWKREFIIDEEEADELNKTAVGVKKKKKYGRKIMMGIVLVGLLFIVIRRTWKGRIKE